MSMMPGTTIGPYRIIEQVGRGGMATVYKAFHASLARYVAMKVLPAFFAEDEDFRQRFQQEAIAVAKLRHPAILVIFDYGEEGGVTYLVSEFVDGGTLAEQLGAPLPLEYTLGILGPVAAAIDYAHGRGILHRDIKPSNILLARDGTPVLSDFGLAKMMGSLSRLTRTGMMVGTPEYMAPEQGMGEEAGPASDRYALAVVAYEMLTGKVPFSAETPLAAMLAHAHNPLPLPRTVNPNLSASVEQVLLKGLAKAPDHRYPTAAALVAALREAGQGASSAAQPAVTPTPMTPVDVEQTKPVPAPPSPVVAAQGPVSPPVAPQVATPVGTRTRRLLPRYAIALLIAAGLLAAAGGGRLLGNSGGGHGAASTPIATTLPVAVASLGITARMSGISCTSVSTCRTVGDDGTIMATHDGGMTWRRQTSGTAASLRGISCAAPTTCYAVGQQGTILATTAGGATWLSRASGTGNTLISISCPATTACYAVGDNGTILSTSDSGETWQGQISDTGNALNGISCQSIATCEAVGDEGTVLTTSDGGETWQRRIPGTGYKLIAISCPTAATCYGVGQKGAVVATTDGATAWQAQTSGTDVALNGISCPTTTTCWAVGDKGTIIATRDGGATWHGRTSGMTGPLRGVDCPSTTVCDIVGAKGTIATLTNA